VRYLDIFWLYTNPLLASWPQEALAERLGVKGAAILGALISWNEEGVLEFNDNQKVWRLVEEGDASRAPSSEITVSLRARTNGPPVIAKQTPLDSRRGTSPKVNDSRDQQSWQVNSASLYRNLRAHNS
jgi:hypothetical protein